MEVLRSGLACSISPEAVEECRLVTSQVWLHPMAHALAQDQGRKPRGLAKQLSRLRADDWPCAVIGPSCILPCHRYALTFGSKGSQIGVVGELGQQLLASGQDSRIHEAVDHVRPGLSRSASRLRSTDDVTRGVGRSEPGVVVDVLGGVADGRRKTTIGEHSALSRHLHHLVQVLGVQLKVLKEPHKGIVVEDAACGEVAYQTVVCCRGVQEEGRREQRRRQPLRCSASTYKAGITAGTCFRPPMWNSWRLLSTWLCTLLRMTLWYALPTTDATYKERYAEGSRWLPARLKASYKSPPHPPLQRLP